MKGRVGKPTKSKGHMGLLIIVGAPKKLGAPLGGGKPKARADKLARGGPPDKWIQEAIKNPGAETKAAKKAGMSTHAYMEKHKHDTGKAGLRARSGLTLSKLAKNK